MKFKAFITKIKNSIWFYPVLYSFFAVILAYLVILIDHSYYYNLDPYIPNIFLTSSELSRTVLTIIAGAFITIMTFSFSTTMIVLTMYSSQFSPRVVENFLSNKSSMKALGVFISGFLYSIISLLFIRKSLVDIQVLSGTIGVIYIILAIIHFILFINNVGIQVQASNLIDKLYNRAEQKIIAYTVDIKNYDIIKNEQIAKIMIKTQIQSPNSGYIQSINYTKLYEIAKETKSVIVLNKVPGQFLTDKTILAGVFYNKDISPDKNLAERIQKCVFIGKRRTEFQDFSFSIQKIVDLALKALAPGNDPNTARECIQNLGLLIRELVHIDDGYVSFKNQKQKSGALYWETYSLDIILRDTFVQILQYGKDDFFIIITILKSYRQIMEKSSDNNKIIIMNHVLYLWAKVKSSFYEDFEFEILKNEYEEILTINRKLYNQEMRTND